MAYETKVILTLLAQQVAQAESLREAYVAIIRAANTEGVNLPDYDELKKEMETEKLKARCRRGMNVCGSF